MFYFKPAFRFLILALCWMFITQQTSGQSIVLDSFIKLKTLGDVTVDLVQSDTFKADYTILKGFERDLTFENKDGQLIIRIRPPQNSKYNRLVTKAKVTLFYKDIREIDIAPLSEVRTMDTLRTSFLKVKTDKGSKGRLTLAVFDLKLESKFRGSMYIQGKTQTLKIEAMTESMIDAQNLTAREADVTASESSKVVLRCERAIYGKSSSGATIQCHGNPTYKNIDEKGGGKFEVK